jgi:hypothetical protein
MRKHFSKTLVAAAVVGAVASGLAGTASAYEYAMSHLLVQNFAFTGTPATPVSFAFDLRNTASLEGFADVIKHAQCSSIGTPCSPTGNVLDAPAAEIPSGVRGGQNNFAFVGPSDVASYASSDSVIYSAQLVNHVPSSAEQIAEVDVAGNGTASGNAELQSNTTVNFGVVLTGNTFSLNFDADPDLRAAINDPPGGSHSALANLTTSFSFSADNLDIQISWAPQGNGILINNCVVSGADSAGVLH